MQQFPTTANVRDYINAVLPSVPFPFTAWHQTGSSIICPQQWAKAPTDIDVVVYYGGALSVAAEALHQAHFTPCSGEAASVYEDEGSFIAYRMGYLNLIVVNTQAAYSRWYAATQAAISLNLTCKQDRVRLFKFIQEEL